jgi:cell division protein FtsI/penicillin-binding protein 2
LKAFEDHGVALRISRFIPAILLAAHLAGPHLRAAENLQLFLNQIMPGKQGAVIVSNPKTGRILALWNPPTALHEAFPPGSTAKVVASAAALEEGVITPAERIQCRRVPRLLGEAYHCSHPAAGQPFDLAAALANSCNYFFCELSARLSSSALAHWYAAFGFGAAGEDTLPGEVHVRDNAREKALAVLGQQGVTATPAQVLLAYSAIATHGEVFRLIEPGQQQAPSIDRIVPLQPPTLAALARGLRQCVESGTGRAAAVEGVAVAGKTGTAPALDGSRATHAWFVGYAPADAPEVAVVVFLKRGTGAGNAAPLAGRVFKQYFALKSRPR